ncbi:hypothetical protein ACHAWO_013857 [Cyclotella atomus]|uniref:Uncharacterized protein n=1 Tax=Cyclotella atomus TaxID=382360 RepID=A0ABD3MTY7_9STRA
MKSWNQFHDPIINDECDMFGYSVILLKDGGLLIGLAVKRNDSGAVYFTLSSRTVHSSIIIRFNKDCARQRVMDPGFNQLAADRNILLVLSAHLHVYAKKENMTWTEDLTEVSAPVRESKLGMSVAISGRKALVSSERNVYAYYIQDC